MKLQDVSWAGMRCHSFFVMISVSVSLLFCVGSLNFPLLLLVLCCGPFMFFALSALGPSLKTYYLFACMNLLAVIFSVMQWRCLVTHLSFFMDNPRFRNWKVLCWNVHGLNSEKRQRDVRAKIEESNCSIVCLQETKCESFDLKFIRQFCPRRFDNFAFAPSHGASGGILVVWNSAFFSGCLIEIQRFAVVVSFTSIHNSEVWNLVSVYGPCDGPLRDDFVQWLYHLQIPVDANWLLLGDFNFIRSLDNRNLPGGDVNDIFLFNEIIGHLGLLELSLKGRAYTWSNMQQQPLLEQLDWFFTSSSWISLYPNTVVHPLARTGSDHIPCLVSIDTTIPRAKKFPV